MNDNAMAEAFFATPECELLDRRSFRSRAEGGVAVFHFVEGFYTPTGRQSALGYLSPPRIRNRSHGREQLIPTRNPCTEAGQLQFQPASATRSGGHHHALMHHGEGA
jgi:hypothetical protein